MGNYDDGVDYAAATGILHRRLPDRDGLAAPSAWRPTAVDPFSAGEGRDQVSLGGRLSISHCTQGVRDDVVIVDMQASLVGRSPG